MRERRRKQGKMRETREDEEKWGKKLKGEKQGEGEGEKIYGEGGVEKMKRETMGNIEIGLEEVDVN